MEQYYNEPKFNNAMDIPDELKKVHVDIDELNEAFENAKVIQLPSEGTLDIHKIIDDAMEKKDRVVSIYIGYAGTSVNVTPYTETKPRWIWKKGTLYCSECGYNVKNDVYPYCPICGEKLALPFNLNKTQQERENAICKET